MRLGSAVTAIAVASAIGGCGGGGGGGTVPPPPGDAPFTSFTGIEPNRNTLLLGTAATATVEITTDTGGNSTVTSANLTPNLGGNVRLRYDDARTLSAISVVNTPWPTTEVSFDRSQPGHSINCGGGVCLAENPTASASFADPAAMGWNYQSFGIWANEFSPTTGA